MSGKPSSFVRKGRGAGPGGGGGGGGSGHPGGTRISPNNGQLLTSSGTPSLDALIGGGLAVGTMLVLDEDVHGSYAKLLTKFFLCEGAAVGHRLLMGSAERNPAAVFAALHPPVADTAGPAKLPPGGGEPAGPRGRSDMEIAWRYRNMRQVDSEVGTGRGVGHNFDVTKTIVGEALAAVQSVGVDVRPRCRAAIGGGAARNTLPQPGPGSPIAALLPVHVELFDRIRVEAEAFAVGTAPPAGTKRSILRIVIESLGSPMWPAGGAGHVSMLRFLTKLKGLLRATYAVCVVTIPGHLLAPAVERRIVHCGDMVIGLQSFAGTPHEKSGPLKDYHGLVRLRKLPRLNSLTHFMPETLDLAFKLKRKRLVIEKIHLPPDLSETVNGNQGEAPASAAAAMTPGGGCQPNPTKVNPLEF